MLRLDTVPIPEPGPGEIRVRVQAIPFNLNDLERISGGNMMVRADAAVQPGHGDDGHRRRVRRGRRGMAGPARGRHHDAAHTAASPSTSICPAASAFDMPETIPLPDAAALLFPFHLAWLGLFDRARAARPARPC